MKTILRKNYWLTVLLLLTILNANAQDRYIVFLKNKANNPYTISNPSEYLSVRAINRRTRMNIPIDSSDLPVNPAYVAAIKNTGAIVLNRSKWLNTMTIQADTNQAIAIGNLPFVVRYKKVFGTNVHKSSVNKFPEENFANPFNKIDSSKYGNAWNQTKMLNADFLHQCGITGSTMQIAVIDAGFRNADTHTAFESLRSKNQILGTWNFTNNTSFVYDYSNHGTSVLSCIGANVPDTMIGMAPDAKFYLLKTEEEATEYLVEEYNWAAAAEYADSAGVDIINSSLGYTEYDAASQSYTYEDMDGNTAPITIAADIAVDKGVLVINSAGNSGSSAWFYIGAPADGKNVLSVGAVDPTNLIAGFSSNGPTADGRTKPDVVAQGGPAWIAKANTGGFGFGSGTSFSGPIIAGFSACAFEMYKTYYPNATPLDFKAWMKALSDNSTNPNNQYGWGIPNGRKLFMALGINLLNNKKTTLYPNPVNDFCQFNIPNSQSAKIAVYTSTGALLIQENLQSATGSFKFSTENFNPGLYVIKILTEDSVYSLTFSKNQ
jgi:hypothetical protein